MGCEKLSTCIFFNDQMESMPAVADVLKRKYCGDDFAGCARFQVAARFGGAGVPGDLFPNDHRRAEAILTEAPD